MAKKRRGGGAAGFLRAFGDAYDLTGKVLMDRDMRKVHDEKAKEFTDGYEYKDATPEQIEAFKKNNQELANKDAEVFGDVQPKEAQGYFANNQEMASKDNEFLAGDDYKGPMRTAADYEYGNVYTTVDPKDRTGGVRLATPHATDYEYGTPKQATAIRKHSFLGQTYDKAPTEQEQDRARMMALSGIYAKHGDPMKAMEMRTKMADMDSKALQQRELEQRMRFADANQQRQTLLDGRVDQDHTRKETLLKGIQGATEDQARAQAMVPGYTDVQEFMAKGGEAAIREQIMANNNEAKAKGQLGTAPPQVDEIIAAYRQAVGDADTTKYQASQQKLYDTLAGLYAQSGDAKAAADFRTKAEAEGVGKTIALLKENRIDEANRAFNGSGELRGFISNAGPDKKTGDLIAEVLDPATGKKSYVNVSELEKRLMGTMDQAKLAEVHSKTAENMAQKAAAQALADKRRLGGRTGAGGGDSKGKPAAALSDKDLDSIASTLDKISGKTIVDPEKRIQAQHVATMLADVEGVNVNAYTVQKVLNGAFVPRVQGAQGQEFKFDVKRMDWVPVAPAKAAPPPNAPGPAAASAQTPKPSPVYRGIQDFIPPPNAGGRPQFQQMTPEKRRALEQYLERSRP